MLRRALPPLSILLATACGSPAEPADSPSSRGKRPRTATPVAASALESALVAEVPAGTFGPYIGSGSRGALVVWAAQKGTTRTWYGRRLNARGEAVGEVKNLGEAASEIGLVAVRSIGPDRWVVVSTRPEGERTAIEARLVGADGALVGRPVMIDTAPAAARWIEAIPTPSGALVFWARQQGDSAELTCATLSLDAKSGEPRRVVGGSRAWQAVSRPGGAAIASVAADGVKLVRVDLTGQVAGTTTLSSSTKSELDLDATRIGDRTLVAWSDRSDLDAAIQLAVVDAEGKLVAPPKAALGAALGDQALVRVVPPAGNGPAYLVWEIVGARAAEQRSFRLASVNADGVIGAGRGEVRVASDDATLPEVVATPRGVAALTLARTCDRTMSAEACAATDRLPSFVELDREFAPLAAEPMRLTALAGAGAELAWGLSCPSSCLALAAVASDPAPVYAVRLESRSRGWKPAGGRLEPQTPPRPLDATTLAAVDPLADIATTRIAGRTLAAWVTYFDPSTPYKRLTKPAPDGRFEPLRALLQVRALPDDGAPLATETISLRARSLGGVSIAAAPDAKSEALLAWAALDYGQPQVFATIVSADGKKLRQQMLTRSKGEKTDVAAAAVSDGYVVAWVDERHGDPEVYAAKLNRQLQRVGQERRLTNAAGAATGLQMVATSDAHVVLAWSDARDSEEPGAGDPHMLLLSASDAAPLGKEQRVASTKAHSFSPVLAFDRGNLVIGWIEADGAVVLGTLDANGKLDGAERRVRVNGSATGLTLACAGEHCRGVASVDTGERSELVAFDWPLAAAPSAAKRLAPLPGPAGQSVAPSLLGDLLLYADQVGDRGRARRMRVQWK